MRPHSFRRVILPAAVLAALIIFVMQLSGTVFEDYLRVDTTGGTTGTGAGAVVFITTDVTAIGNGAGDVLPVTEEDHTHNHPPPQERKQQQQQDLQQPQQQEQLQLVPNKSTSTGQTLVKRKDEGMFGCWFPLVLGTQSLPKDMFLDEPFNPRESLQQQEEEEEEVKEGVDERIVRLAENDNDGVDIEGVEQLNDEKPDLQAQLAQLQEQQERLNSVGITSAWESVSKTSSIGGNPVSLPDNRYTRRAQAVRKSSQPTQPPHETSWWYQFKYNPGWAPQSTPSTGRGKSCLLFFLEQVISPLFFCCRKTPPGRSQNCPRRRERAAARPVFVRSAQGHRLGDLCQSHVCCQGQPDDQVDRASRVVRRLPSGQQRRLLQDTQDRLDDHELYLLPFWREAPAPLPRLSHPLHRVYDPRAHLPSQHLNVPPPNAPAGLQLYRDHVVVPHQGAQPPVCDDRPRAPQARHVRVALPAPARLWQRHPRHGPRRQLLAPCQLVYPRNRPGHLHRL